MDISFLLSQILVGIAFFSDFTSFQFKDRKKILFFLCISSILISAHYFLLDKETAGVLVLISALRYITSYFSTKKIVMITLLGLGIIGFISTYSSPASLFMFGAMILFTIGAFQKNDKFLRLLMMTGTILVITYDVIIFSPMAILLESFFLVSNILGYYRFYIQKTS